MTQTVELTAAAQLAEQTSDAYSADRYGHEWVKCAEYLLGLGLSVADAEQVLRSKVMRWAADSYSDDYEGEADHLRQWMTSCSRPFAGLGLRSKAGRRYA